jgi:gliding motility-associated-like protein
MTAFMYFVMHDSNAQFQINGDATVLDCKCYQLNQNLPNKSGSVWNINQIDLNQSFDYSFTVNLGCNNTSQWTGADGMVFALQSISTSIGTAGGGMGLGGVSPSVGVFIDTYQNTAHGDPFNDHISINLNGDFTHNTANNVAGPYDLGEIEDCLDDDLRIIWNTTTNTLSVLYNSVLVLNYIGDIVNNVFGGNSMVYWGFTAATGGAYNTHQFCIDIPDIVIDTNSMTVIDEHCLSSDGSITGITYSGGLSPIELTWNNAIVNSIDTINLNAGFYTFEVSDGLGCSLATDSIEIVNLDGPTTDSSALIINYEACDQNNGSISGLSTNGPSSPFQYDWNGILSTLDQSNLDSGSYSLVTTDNFGCTDTTNFYIPFVDGPSIDTSALSIYNEDCNQGNGSIENIFINNGTFPIQHLWNDSLSNQTNAYNLNAGSYELMVVDSNNCADSIVLSIIDWNYHSTSITYSSISNDLISNSVINFEEINDGSSVSWNWDFGDSTYSSLTNPDHSFSYIGNYTICLIANNQFNCFDTACIDLEILPEPIVIPNVITPNNDFNNDLFYIQGINDRFSITIMNRWGNIVYESSPYQNNWDGRTNSGKPLSEGTYFYVLYNDIDNIKFQGSFQLFSYYE